MQTTDITLTPAFIEHVLPILKRSSTYKERLDVHPGAFSVDFLSHGMAWRCFYVARENGIKVGVHKEGHELVIFIEAFSTPKGPLNIEIEKRSHACSRVAKTDKDLFRVTMLATLRAAANNL